jgi:hypothetical protein
VGIGAVLTVGVGRVESTRAITATSCGALLHLPNSRDQLSVDVQVADDESLVHLDAAQRRQVLLLRVLLLLDGFRRPVDSTSAVRPDPGLVAEGTGRVLRILRLLLFHVLLGPLQALLAAFPLALLVLRTEEGSDEPSRPIKTTTPTIMQSNRNYRRAIILVCSTRMERLI